MPKAKTSRKALFRAALAGVELTAAQWAEREGITPEHLSLVLNGKRESRSLDEKIDGFIRVRLNEHAALANA